MSITFWSIDKYFKVAQISYDNMFFHHKTNRFFKLWWYLFQHPYGNNQKKIKIHMAALDYSTEVTPKLEFSTWMITLKYNWMMQEKVTCILIGLLASVFAWELQEGLLISMRTQGRGLYIEMSRLAIFWLMENYAPKYQILDWQSFTMTRKPISALEL